MSTQDSPANPADPIDFEHLKQYVGDDPAIIKEVFGMFKHQTEMWVRGLSADMPDEDWAAILHTLKGSARAVGALELGALCEKGEHMVGENGRAGVREANLQNIKFAIEQAKIEIARWEYRQTLASLRS